MSGNNRFLTGVSMRPYINYLMLAAIAFIVFDAVTTLYGFSLGFEEKNIITLQFISLFGEFGVIVASITKTGMLVLPYIIYNQIIKHMKLTENKMRFYEIVYTAAVIAAGLSALNSGIKNLVVLSSSIL